MSPIVPLSLVEAPLFPCWHVLVSPESMAKHSQPCVTREALQSDCVRLPAAGDGLLSTVDSAPLALGDQTRVGRGLSYVAPLETGHLLLRASRGWPLSGHTSLSSSVGSSLCHKTFNLLSFLGHL